MRCDLFHGDCLNLIPDIPDSSVDLVLADPPYGTTACKWDSVIPLQPMWEQLKRVIKPKAAIVMTASQPFTTTLIASNMPMFKYEWIYEKTNAKGFLSAKSRPLTSHENVVVFCGGATKVYNPQKWQMPEHLQTKRKHMTAKTSGDVYGEIKMVRYNDDGSRHPTSVIGFSNRSERGGNYHPTQKPVALMEYMIKTYTQEGETVLDFTMGSGTTGVACKNLSRNFIGIEKDAEYFEIASERIASHKAQII